MQKCYVGPLYSSKC